MSRAGFVSAVVVRFVLGRITGSVDHRYNSFSAALVRSLSVRLPERSQQRMVLQFLAGTLHLR
ncbi:hypothetical protein DQ354_06510 [Arthrobacter sp. AQ5-06]|nr:hypothetical protein DQ354_06510 [Arthrobacter sp. AQ5-06]